MRHRYHCGICGSPINDEDNGTGMEEHNDDWTKHGFDHASCYWKDKFEKKTLDFDELNLRYVATLNHFNDGLTAIQDKQCINRTLRKKVDIRIIELSEYIETIGR